MAFAAPTPFKITGGGQVLASADSSGVKGPGDTLTFQAQIAEQGLNEDATGAINLIDRNGTGKGGVHYKGTVDCAYLASDPVTGGGYAELFGTATKKDGTETDFVVRIQDNGQGADNTDLVEFDLTDPESCGENDEQEEPGTFLGRGNAKIHKQNPSTAKGQSSSSSSSTSTSASLLSLR